ncbi:hypothetical protein CERSUDRAFT_117107 [Gelatoporia subvermispora B]|uniref:Uncharacterized protein n=1 Tax=Ceriporiopsis subvermispora (strain B) TaxID=914234 RepID=M2PEA7_CERS8|nr:hypothetical protein CERSUDRAFT_117107 [Gelatoporia subvermispora B]
MRPHNKCAVARDTEKAITVSVAYKMALRTAYAWALSHRVPGPGDCSRPYHISRGSRLVDGVDRRNAWECIIFPHWGFLSGARQVLTMRLPMWASRTHTSGPERSVRCTRGTRRGCARGDWSEIGTPLRFLSRLSGPW